MLFINSNSLKIFSCSVFCRKETKCRLWAAAQRASRWILARRLSRSHHPCRFCCSKLRLNLQHSNAEMCKRCHQQLRAAPRIVGQTTWRARGASRRKCGRRARRDRGRSLPGWWRGGFLWTRRWVQGPVWVGQLLASRVHWFGDWIDLFSWWAEKRKQETTAIWSRFGNVWWVFGSRERSVPAKRNEKLRDCFCFSFFNRLLISFLFFYR